MSSKHFMNSLPFLSNSIRLLSFFSLPLFLSFTIIIIAHIRQNVKQKVFNNSRNFLSILTKTAVADYHP
nr:MAG TPA: hypothetical protein [Caudoviricetes sp.]